MRVRFSAEAIGEFRSAKSRSAKSAAQKADRRKAQRKRPKSEKKRSAKSLGERRSENSWNSAKSAAKNAPANFAAQKSQNPKKAQRKKLRRKAQRKFLDFGVLRCAHRRNFLRTRKNRKGRGILRFNHLYVQIVLLAHSRAIFSSKIGIEFFGKSCLVFVMLGKTSTFCRHRSLERWLIGER